MKKIYIFLLLATAAIRLTAQSSPSLFSQESPIESPSAGVHPIVYFIDTAVSVSEISTTFLFQLGIINPNSAPTSVDVKLIGGTATEGVDYIFDSIQTVTFAADSSSPISVIGTIVNDITPEPNETILIALLNPTNQATIVEDTLIITIMDNDQVGIGNNFSLPGVKIFPAVSNGIFNVNTDLNSIVLVKDILGNNIWQKNDATGTLKLDLENQAKGIYFITVENTQGRMAKKVIIQ
jgi:hypothetical protein